MANEFKHKDPGTELTQAEFIASDGTGHIFESQAQGDVLYASSATVLARLGKDANATRALTNTGTNNNPAWAQIVLTTGVTGTLPVGNGGTGITSLGSNVATFLGTPSSSNLASAVTGETGSGALVFGTSPTLVTPALGTPASGVMTNVSGTASSLTAGTVTTNANLTGVVTSSGNATAIADKAIAVAKLADGTDGELITWDASGVIAVVAVGSADEVLTSNGSGAAPTFQAAGGGGATVREGGQTTEATTTSTSATDLLTAASLTIALTDPFQYTGVARKSTGAAARCALGTKINSTTIGSADVNLRTQWGSDDADRANDGGFSTFFPPRVITAYDQQGTTLFFSYHSNNDIGLGGREGTGRSAAYPDAALTDLIMVGVSGNASITLGADELQVYSFVTS